MKNILAGLFCVGLCIAVAVFLPQTGTSNPNVDDTGCLAAGCHDFGTLHTLHPGACDACHPTPTGGLPVETATCLACHPEENSELCDLALAHPEAGCLAMGCHADCEVAEGCTVTIACEETTLCLDDGCTTCTATTECDGMAVGGVYSWSINMAGTTGNTGNSIEICPDDLELGDNALMVVDTANEDAEDTETLILEECGPTECQVDVVADSLPKSNWFILPLVLRIETEGIDPTFLTPVNIACDADGMGLFGISSIWTVGKITLPSFGTRTTVIISNVLIWPSWVTQSGDRTSETCTVTVGECGDTDTFELSYLPFFLSE